MPEQSPKEKRRPKKKGKMADPNDPQSCFRWIRDEEIVHRSEGYGENKRSVLDALEDQGHRTRVVGDFSKTVEKVKGEHKDEMKTSYANLKLISDKRLSCLEDIAQIAGLEDLLGALTTEFAEKASSLVAKECAHPGELPQEAGDGVQAAAQNCILAVRKNWAWISKLVKCTDVHLQHSSDYHQFYHEVSEYQHWMPLQLRAAVNKVALRQKPQGSNDEAHSLLLDLKELLAVFLHWQGKLECLFNRSKTLVPVPLRTQRIQYFRPVSSLCDYKTHDIEVREGEELLLLDNSDTQSWTVRNLNAAESKVPSVICVIPGPDPGAVEAAMKLRLELLMIWTENVKRIGKDLILFLILILRDWTNDEIKMLKAMRPDQKAEMKKLLDGIVIRLAPHWEGFDGFKEGKRRVEETKKILSGKGNDADRVDQFSDPLLDRVKTTDEVMLRFGDMWNNWDTYRLMLETCKHPDYMLLCDKLEQLKFMSVDDLRKLWQAGMRFGADDNESFESWLRKTRTVWEQEGGYGRANVGHGRGKGGYGRGGDERTSAGRTGAGAGAVNGHGGNMYSTTELRTETLTCESVDGLGSAMNGSQTATSSSTSMDERFETASTSQFTTTEQEEKKTFIITGVLNPSTGETVSMHQAVMLGIIDSSKGTYNDEKKKETIPIPVAMSQGLIKVEFTTTKKSAEKRHDVGLITLKTHKESRPYTVKSVVDTKTDKHLTVDQAIAKGILDQQKGMYISSADNSQMSLADALDSGLLIVEFDSEAEVAEPEVVTKTYAIHGVVDQRKKAKVTFGEAVMTGLLDKETGAYYHNVDKEHIYVGDAIRRGFIKATVVQDPTSLDIDPENKMVVEKVQTIRNKLLNPMRALAAMKKAAAQGKNQ